MGRPVEQSTAKLTFSVILVTVILGGKLTGAFISNSLALFSDSWHLMTDLAALLVSWWGLRAASKPANYRHTFGYYRHGILTALINNVSLIIISVVILFKAVERYFNPVQVEPAGMMIFAVLGLVVNSIIVFNLKGSTNLNVRSAFLHFTGDALADIGVLLGGVVIYLTGWTGIDTLLSAVLAGLILKSAVQMSRECIAIFLEANPQEISIREVRQAVKSIEGVYEVTDLHIWSLSKEVLAMTAHVCTTQCHLQKCEEILHQIQHVLQEQFGIGHSTIQFESAPCSSCFHSKPDHSSECRMCIDSEYREC